MTRGRQGQDVADIVGGNIARETACHRNGRGDLVGDGETGDSVCGFQRASKRSHEHLSV